MRDARFQTNKDGKSMVQKKCIEGKNRVETF